MEADYEVKDDIDKVEDEKFMRNWMSMRRRRTSAKGGDGGLMM